VSVENEAAPATSGAVIVKHRMPIAEAFERGTGAFDVQMAPDGKGVVLYDRTVIEDDGPGACAGGGDWQVARGKVVGKLIAKKIIHVDRPVASGQQVILWAGALSTETAPLSVRVNGRKFEPRPFVEMIGDKEVHIVDLRPRILQQGDNEIILSCEGERGWWIGLAQRADIVRNAPERKDRPVRSFRSTDRGRKWSELVSANEQIAGEFMVRVRLDQYAAYGELLGPIIDLGEMAGRKTILPPKVEVASVTVHASKRLPKGTSIEMSVRGGTTPLVEAGAWGEWQAADEQEKVAGPLARFVQWRAVLKTDEPKVTPFLGNVELAAEVRKAAPAWTDKVRVLERVNPEVLFTSIPFEYERFDQPELAEIRLANKLDELVAGAATELEKMIRIQNWVHGQWKFQAPAPPYPAWDAREILRRKEGFCVQYAIVCMQCALSLGLQTRFTFGIAPRGRTGDAVCGHEVVEFWSDEHGKWVLIDASQNECFVDAKPTGPLSGTGVPCNMLDLHQEVLDTYFPGAAIGEGLNEFPAERPSTLTKIWKALEPAPQEAPYPVHLKWGSVRWMPRNNFFAHRFPEPLAQGRSPWCWNGYWNWCDERSPRTPNYGRYTSRRSDIEWTINQVRWSLEAAEEAGLVDLSLGTVTPDFDTFLASVDGGEWQPQGAKFAWRLHNGQNRVELRIRNRAGVLGKPSAVEVKYTGK
jgi:transglutaminase-like putative cysteine protease